MQNIWNQGRVHYMKKLYSTPESNKAFVKKYVWGKKLKSTRVVTSTYKNFPVLEFWDDGKAQKTPAFTLGRWKLMVILNHLDEIKKFIDSKD